MQHQGCPPRLRKIQSKPQSSTRAIPCSLGALLSPTARSPLQELLVSVRFITTEALLDEERVDVAVRGCTGQYSSCFRRGVIYFKFGSELRWEATIAQGRTRIWGHCIFGRVDHRGGSNEDESVDQHRVNANYDTHGEQLVPGQALNEHVIGAVNASVAFPKLFPSKNDQTHARPCF